MATILTAEALKDVAADLGLLDGSPAEVSNGTLLAGEDQMPVHFRRGHDRKMWVVLTSTWEETESVL